MSQARHVVLDNEAVQALLDPGHRKHRRVLAIVEATAMRNRRRSGAVRLVVPTSVRVEAGWNRRSPGASGLNRLRADDAILDGQAADLAARIRQQLGVSVPDAHLGAVMAVTDAAHAVVTSDQQDLSAIAAHLSSPTTVVPI